MCRRSARRVTRQLRWISDGTEIHGLASACTSNAYRSSQGTFSTSVVIFSYILCKHLVQKNFYQNAETRKLAVNQSHSPTEGTSEVTSLCRCSETPSKSLLFLKKEECSHKPATASEALLRRLMPPAVRAESGCKNKTPGPVVTSGPDLLKQSHYLPEQIPDLSQSI